MISGLTNNQKAKIKEMVDQLIVGHGVLTISDCPMSIDGMDTNQLCRLAFKYYKMIYSGENPLDIGLADSGGSPSLEGEINAQAGLCLGCNKQLTEADESMPVCLACRNQLKADYDVLNELLR